MKKCSKCGQWKSEDSFHKNIQSPSGLHGNCKDCRKVYWKREMERKCLHKSPRNVIRKVNDRQKKYTRPFEKNLASIFAGHKSSSNGHVEWNFEEFYSWSINCGYDGNMKFHRIDTQKPFNSENCVLMNKTDYYRYRSYNEQMKDILHRYLLARDCLIKGSFLLKGK